METVVRYVIYLHAFSGGLALVAGIISIMAKKGQMVHRKSGLIFYYGMLTSGLTAMCVSLMPGHVSPFFFAVGIFSLYFVLAGYRALKFKRRGHDFRIDKFISTVMCISGLLMMVLPYLLQGKPNIVLVVFGLVGMLFSFRDLSIFKYPKRARSKWLQIHLSKMMGAFISSTTAFVVVNQYLSGLYAWFVPGIVGTLVIIYWNSKIKKKFPKIDASVSKK